MKFGKHSYNIDVKAILKKKIAAPKIAHLHLNNNDKYWFLKIVIQNNKHASLSFKNNYISKVQAHFHFIVNTSKYQHYVRLFIHEQ